MFQPYVDSSERFKYVWENDGTPEMIYDFWEILALGGSFYSWGWNDEADSAPHNLEIERDGFSNSLTILVFKGYRQDKQLKATLKVTIYDLPKLLNEDRLFKFWYWGCQPMERHGQTTAVRPAWSTVARRQYPLYIFHQSQITSSYDATSPIFPLRCVEMLEAIDRTNLKGKRTSKIAFVANSMTIFTYGVNRFLNGAFNSPYAFQNNYMVFRDDTHLAEVFEKAKGWANIESGRDAIYVGNEEYGKGTKIDFATGIEFFEMNGDFS